MTDALVEATLTSYGELVRGAMEPYLAPTDPAGHLDDLVADYPRRPGKGLRPAVLLATCQALGGTARAGLAPAVALELLHNAFLVHDDIEDASPRRRGDPTLHERHGVAAAINAGDALAARAMQPLRADPVLGPRLCRLLLDELDTAVRLTTEGQALELGWRRHHVLALDPTDYLRLAAKKTCWYTTVAPLRMGALAGTRGAARAAALTRFGLHLGLAFQIRDDLLDLDPDADTGKDSHSDLREGKRTLMLIHLLTHGGPSDRTWLAEHLGRPGSERRIVELMRDHGSIAFAEDYAAGLTAAAQEALDDAFRGVPASEHLEFLRRLVPYVAQRPH